MREWQHDALNYWGLPWPVVLVGGLVLGGLVGAINGFFIANAATIVKW